jgi:drug/metabolite transporter (DMT)-like permease
MTPFPKPRGFWDYALFALAMTGALVFLFWLEARDGIGWADAALACAAAVLLVFAIIFARRGEKARWIAQPTWYAYVLAALGAFALMFGAIYADGYLLHRRDITSNRLGHDMVLAIVVTAGTVWSFLRRHRSKRQLS